MELDKVILEDLEAICSRNIRFEALRDSTVLISGVSGMIASYMTYTLLYLNDTRDLKIRVLGLARNEEKAKKRFGALLEREDFALVIGDITEPVAIAEPVDYIIHAASQTGPQQFMKDPVGTIAANTTGTLHLLKLARQKESKGFLFLSTREIYGQVPAEKEKVTEDEYGAFDPTLVRSCYPESKRMSETMCAAYRHQYQVPAKIVRIAHTYGPGMLIGDGRVVGDFLSNVINGEDIVMNSTGEAVLGLTYISDLIAGIFMAFLDFEDFVYNISSEKGILTVRELAELLAGLDEKKGLAVRFQEISGEKKAGYLSHKVPLLSSAKAEALGWDPSVGLKEGFRRTIAYFERLKGK